MSSKQTVEVELVRQFLAKYGQLETRLEPADKPDVIAHIGPRRIGVEVTQFHSDERSGTKGSQIRAKEVKTAKASGGRPYTMGPRQIPSLASLRGLPRKLPPPAPTITERMTNCGRLYLAAFQ